MRKYNYSFYTKFLIDKCYVSWREDDTGRGAFLALCKEHKNKWERKKLEYSYYYIFGEDGMIERFEENIEKEKL